jgi:hypothetical protein
MLQQREIERVKKSTKSIPLAAGGAKAIAAEKKASKVQDEDGNWITMDQFLAKSKEGGAGKGGRGVK